MKQRPLELLVLYHIWKKPNINKYQIEKDIGSTHYSKVWECVKRLLEKDMIKGIESVNKNNQFTTLYTMKKSFNNFEDLFLWYIERHQNG